MPLMQKALRRLQTAYNQRGAVSGGQEHWAPSRAGRGLPRVHCWWGGMLTSLFHVPRCSVQEGAEVESRAGVWVEALSFPCLFSLELGCLSAPLWWLTQDQERSRAGKKGRGRQTSFSPPPSAAPSLRLAPGPAPNAQSDQFEPAQRVFWAEGGRLGAWGLASWPGPRDRAREPRGQQSTCHEHLESSASLRVGCERPHHPAPGSRQDSQASPGLSKERESR